MSKQENEHFSWPALEVLAGLACLTFSAGNPLIIAAGLGLLGVGLVNGQRS